ncbi:hypothetical protein F4809DRAFT_613377 [Biscogniauxia mediterranea]|nr:hypothetical protein F4809DRAFT_613377 [Biscogniauxia mediterranea]
MATLVAFPYSHKHYDSLPDIMDASKALATSGALDSLASTIGSVFVKHGVENVFGLILLHRHFDMEPTELLVGFGHVSVPWNTTCNRGEMNNVKPISWRFLPEGIVPYEFTTDKATVLPESQGYDAFVQELGDLLKAMHLDQLLGLCQIPESSIRSPATMEFTSGRANVTVPDVMWVLDSESAAVEASWQFETQGTTDGPGPVVFKKCKNKCEYKAATQTHTQRHLTTKK